MFFRFILFIWADIVVGVVITGAGWIMAFIAWLITLITGKLPAPLHLAYTAVFGSGPASTATSSCSPRRPLEAVR